MLFCRIEFKIQIQSNSDEIPQSWVESDMSLAKFADLYENIN